VLQVRLVCYLFLSESLAEASFSFFWSPIIDLAGQNEKMGHFLQPVAIATGQSIMTSPAPWVPQQCMPVRGQNEMF
jgi:hypothetical protein